LDRGEREKAGEVIVAETRPSISKTNPSGKNTHLSSVHALNFLSEGIKRAEAP